MGNCKMVGAFLPFLEVWMFEDGLIYQLDGFIGLDTDFIEGLLAIESKPSRGIGEALMILEGILWSLLKLGVSQ